MSAEPLGFWGYLDSRADRRDARKLLLIDRGLDWRSMFCKGLTSSDPRFLIALSIIGLFAWAFAREVDSDTRKLMIGALIAAFAGAWGYYLGSSSSAAKSGERTDAALALSHEAMKQLPPPTPKPENELELEPGERATVQAREEGD
jgi:hypothetical protein